MPCQNPTRVCITCHAELPHYHYISLSLGSAPLASASPTEGTRYLGLIYDTAASAGTMAAHRASCFSSSFHAATAQMRAAPDFPCALPAFLKLLHTVMEPAGLYGCCQCELWGLLSIPGLWSSGWTLAKFYSLTDPLEVKQTNKNLRCGNRKGLLGLSGAVWSVSGCSSLSLCLFCLC